MLKEIQKKRYMEFSERVNATHVEKSKEDGN